MNKTPQPQRLPLGVLTATRGALAHLAITGQRPQPYVRRHQYGDYGVMDAEDVATNRWALQHGARIVSAYQLGDKQIWIITEGDRSATTILLPEEF